MSTCWSTWISVFTQWSPAHILYIKFLVHSRYLIYFVFLSSMYQCIEFHIPDLPTLLSIAASLLQKPLPSTLLGCQRSGEKYRALSAKVHSQFKEQSWAWSSSTPKNIWWKWGILETVAGYMLLRCVWKYTNPQHLSYHSTQDNVPLTWK